MHLLMSGDDLLGAGTGTTVVSQRSEAGLDQEYCTKAGIGKYDMLYDVVCEAVMSSCMSAGCYLTERRDMVPYLAITAKPEFSPFLAFIFLILPFWYEL
jgi:hypothetical protein